MSRAECSLPLIMRTYRICCDVFLLIRKCFSSETCTRVSQQGFGSAQPEPPRQQSPLKSSTRLDCPSSCHQWLAHQMPNQCCPKFPLTSRLFPQNHDNRPNQTNGPEKNLIDLRNDVASCTKRVTTGNNAHDIKSLQEARIYEKNTFETMHGKTIQR